MPSFAFAKAKGKGKSDLKKITSSYFFLGSEAPPSCLCEARAEGRAEGSVI
jgi:hypothetical protein